MADVFSTQSPFVDKEADAADLERQHQTNLATINAMKSAMGSGGSAPDSPFVGGQTSAAPASNTPTPEQMGVGAPAAAAPPASPFDSFNKLLADTDPSLAALRAKAVSGANAQFDNPAAAFDQGAAISREDLGRSIQSARDSQRDDLIKTYGSNASQVMPQLNDFDQNAILQSRDLNRRLTADRATAANTGVTTAIQNAMGILGQQSQDQLGKAGLSLSAAQSAQQQGQFDKSLETQVSQADKDRQFAAAESALGRTFTTSERQSVQDFQSAERQGAQDFASAEALLGRTFSTSEREAIQAYQTNERLSTQDYTSLMTEKGYVHDTQLETMRDNLQKELQATGISADQAKQQADQKFQELTQKRDQDFTATQTDLNRKFTTGERVDAQDYQKSIQANEFKQQDSLAQLQTLTQKAIAQGGWDNASKMQAEQLLASASEAEKNRSAQYLMFSAQQAQDDSHFAAEFGLKKDELAASTENTKAQLGIALQQLGISKDQWETQKNDAAFNKDLELAQYGLEMWNGDNEDAIKPFVTKLATTVGKSLGMDEATLEKAISSKYSATATAAGTAATTKAAFDAFDSIIDKKAGSVSPEATDALKTYAKTLANTYGSQPAGTAINLDNFHGSDLDAAAARLRSKGAKVDDALIDKGSKSTGALGMQSESTYSGTPEFANYALYTKLLSSGLTEADAKDSLMNLVGKDKAAAALALETRK